MKPLANDKIAYKHYFLSLPLSGDCGGASSASRSAEAVYLF